MLWRSALDVNKYFLLLQRFKLSESENVKDFQVANNISITKAQIWSGGRVHLVTLLVLHLYVTNTRPLYPVLISIRMPPTAASGPRFNRKKTPAAMTSLCRIATFFLEKNLFSTCLSAFFVERFLRWALFWALKKPLKVFWKLTRRGPSFIIKAKPFRFLARLSGNYCS